MKKILPCSEEPNRWHQQAIKALLQVTILHSFLAKHFFNRLISISAAHPLFDLTGSLFYGLYCWDGEMTRKMVEGNHYSLPLFLYLLFFLINLCPPPVFLLYERRANTWRDLRAAELGRFNILILVYCPAAQSQTRWLYWHVLLRWHSDELARSKGKRRWELGERKKWI